MRILLVCFLFAAAAGAQNTIPQSLAKIRILLVMDTAAEKIGESVKDDAENIKGLFRHIFENPKYPRFKGRAIIDTLGEDGNKVGILELANYFRNFPLSPEEGLLIYYSGHGAFDKTVAQGHYIAMSGGNMDRYGLRQATQYMGANLKIYITDACGSLSRLARDSIFKVPPRPPLQGTPATGVDDPPGLIVLAREEERIWEDLFFRHRGVVDINAASPGEFAFGTPGPGGFFTYHFERALSAPTEKALDLDGNGFTSWSEAFTVIRDRTSDFFKKRRAAYIAVHGTDNEIARSADQRPYAWGLGSLTENWAHGPFITLGKELKGQRGMLVYSSWAVVGHAGEKVVAAHYFFDENGDQLNDIDSQYRSQSGKVAMLLFDTTLPQNITRSMPLGRFMPYDQLDIRASGTHRVGIELRVVSRETGQVLVTSPRRYFLYTR
ncbi:hypothetical protein K2X33_02130 [bacterium]|nr:hypothetical protein [bacterium]